MNTGEIVPTGSPHRIGDDHYIYCLDFPDPDYTFDVALMTKRYVEEIREQDMSMEAMVGRIRNSIMQTIR